MIMACRRGLLILFIQRIFRPFILCLGRFCQVLEVLGKFFFTFAEIHFLNLK